jgi:hypothetical protein
VAYHSHIQILRLNPSEDARALLRKLQSYNYKFYDMKTPGWKPPPTIEPAILLQKYPLDAPESHTNLMLLRGGRQPPKI